MLRALKKINKKLLQEANQIIYKFSTQTGRHFICREMQCVRYNHKCHDSFCSASSVKNRDIQCTCEENKHSHQSIGMSVSLKDIYILQVFKLLLNSFKFRNTHKYTFNKCIRLLNKHDA